MRRRRRLPRRNPVAWRSSDDVTIRDATSDDIVFALIVAIPLTGWLVYSIYNKLTANTSAVSSS